MPFHPQSDVDSSRVTQNANVRYDYRLVCIYVGETLCFSQQSYCEIVWVSKRLYTIGGINQDICVVIDLCFDTCFAYSLLKVWIDPHMTHS